MYFSKYNIFSRIHNSDKYFIINPLSQQADILSADEAQKIQSGKFDDMDGLTEKGYVVDEAEEKALYRKKYVQFLQERETDEIQLFFVMNYSCNFACSYCYQSEYQQEHQPISKEVMNAFFDYVSDTFAGRKKYITLFGGEPLLASEKQKENVTYFVEQCKHHGLSLALVTNGYELESYLEILKKTTIKEIQVTLDGTEKLHDSRRFLHGGKPTFNKIVQSIDKALQSGVTINLRVILDKGNISGLVDLADYAINKGWTSLSNFKTQLGRNYELHTCQTNRGVLYSRLEMYRDLFDLLKKNPQLAEFHKPGFSITKYLFENNELPDPLFDSCPGCKTEWAFDFTGKIFACTATVGKNDAVLGTFYPSKKLNQHHVDIWQNRDVLSIEKCKTCHLQLACGGGCAAVAFNKTGNYNGPDCRPVNDLISLGMNYYFINSEK
jgi:uncharacterized protein